MPLETTQSAAEVAIRYAVSTLGLPSKWPGSRLVPLKHILPESKLEGAAALTSDAVPFLWIVVAGDARGTAEIETAEHLLGSRVTSAAVIVDADGESASVLRRRFDRDECDSSSPLEPCGFSTAEGRLQPFVRGGIDAHSGKVLQPLTTGVENLLFEMHSDLRDIDGLHSDAALDELCKLILLKTADELACDFGQPTRLQRWGNSCDDELATVARYLQEHLVPDALGQAVGHFGKGVGSVLTSPFKSSNAALVSLISQIESYSLVDSDIDLKARAFQRVLSPAIRAGMGQYFTPLEVIRFMVEVAQPRSGERILDPFAGSGHFLSTSFSLLLGRPNRNAGVEGDSLHSNELHAIEKSDRMVRVAAADMLMHGCIHTAFHCCDALSPFSNLNGGLCRESFDLVLTNPPFGSLLRVAAIQRLGPFTIAQGRRSAPLEVLGLERCLEFLRPGGRLGIILPDGLLANGGTSYVRKWLLQMAVPRAIVSLPIETFAPFGANVKTSILFCRKRADGELLNRSSKVFMATCNNVGYDAAGRDRGDGDLTELAGKLRDFFDQEGW